MSVCVAMQILLKELTSQKRTIDKLEDTIEALVKRSGRSWSPLIGRQQEIVSMFIDIQASARERRDELLDRLNEVHCWTFLMMMSDGVRFCLHLGHFALMLNLKNVEGRNNEQDVMSF